MGSNARPDNFTHKQQSQNPDAYYELPDQKAISYTFDQNDRFDEPK